jgi:hypothetical protein
MDETVGKTKEVVVNFCRPRQMVGISVVFRAWFKA